MIAMGRIDVSDPPTWCDRACADPRTQPIGGTPPRDRVRLGHLTRRKRRAPARRRGLRGGTRNRNATLARGVGIRGATITPQRTRTGPATPASLGTARISTCARHAHRVLASTGVSAGGAYHSCTVGFLAWADHRILLPPRRGLI